jgi:uncharacterized protein
VIVVDTSIIVAYMNAADDYHATVAGWLDGADDDLATTPLIIAEVDHLVGARGGRTARRALHLDLAARAYLVEWWPGAIAPVVTIAERYADTGLGLAGASLAFLCQSPVIHRNIRGVMRVSAGGEVDDLQVFRHGSTARPRYSGR